MQAKRDALFGNPVLFGTPLPYLTAIRDLATLTVDCPAPPYRYLTAMYLSAPSEKDEDMLRVWQ